MSVSTTTLLALDAHGGDQGLDVSVPAALNALKFDEELLITLVGDEDKIESLLSSASSRSMARSTARYRKRISVKGADSVIPMDAGPDAVLRRGKDSSMWNAFELVAEGEAAACISGGSTVAMMALGVKLIGTLTGIQRPALMGYVPNIKGYTGLLDLGANLKVSAKQLVQFAVMGSVTASLAEGVENPSVGLLNVGHEDSKGHDLVREAHGMLNELPLNYAGFIEGHDIFNGKVDIAVCDGFAGNLIIKSSEGLARMIMKDLQATLDESWASRLGALLARPELRRLLVRRDPSSHNGVPLLGLNRVVIKSHGGADCNGMTRAILEAGREARRQVPKKIEASIHKYHLETTS
jgi:glycerol-3-phosphate acyltransferase PlsX